MSICSCLQARDKFLDTFDWYMPTGLGRMYYRERMHGSSSKESPSPTNRCSPSTLDLLLGTVHCCTDTSIVPREHIHHVHYRRQCRWNKRSPLCIPCSVNGIGRSSGWDFDTWQDMPTHSLRRSCSVTRIVSLAKRKHETVKGCHLDDLQQPASDRHDTSWTLCRWHSST